MSALAPVAPPRARRGVRDDRRARRRSDPRHADVAGRARQRRRRISPRGERAHDARSPAARARQRPHPPRPGRAEAGAEVDRRDRTRRSPGPGRLRPAGRRHQTRPPGGGSCHGRSHAPHRSGRRSVGCGGAAHTESADDRRGSGTGAGVGGGPRRIDGSPVRRGAVRPVDLPGLTVVGFQAARRRSRAARTQLWDGGSAPCRTSWPGSTRRR